MARQRQEVLRKLTEEGIIDLNKELAWPLLPQRIAVVSSPTAAGYGDFIDQLHHNPYGYRFYTTLYAASMQGLRAEESIIEAFNAIFRNEEAYDGVVIIRGGGATSELNCFDSYPLAQNIAQFPLPVIAGIGHDRDETVIDRIANVRVKTPTAAAEWLIDRAREADRRRVDLQSRLSEKILYRLQEQRGHIRLIGMRLPQAVGYRLMTAKNDLTRFPDRLRQSTATRLQRERQRLALWTETVRLSSPQLILKRGYSLTLKEGKAVRSADELHVGDRIITLFGKGSQESQIV